MIVVKTILEILKNITNLVNAKLINFERNQEKQYSSTNWCK